MSDRERFYADGERVMLNFTGDGLYRATAGSREDAVRIVEMLNDEIDRTRAALHRILGAVALLRDVRDRYCDDYPGLRGRIVAFLNNFADQPEPGGEGDE